jgi:hypothetical protein
MASRRELQFAKLDDVMPEVDRLSLGYAAVGKWSLGQICNHLAKAVRASTRGASIAPMAPWLVRKTLGAVVLNRILRAGRMREGIEVPEAVLPKPGLDDRKEIEAFREALAEFAAHSGPLADHPFFGRMTREQWIRLHCVHSAHHLSFALPAAKPAETVA